MLLDRGLEMLLGVGEFLLEGVLLVEGKAGTCPGRGQSDLKARDQNVG